MTQRILVVDDEPDITALVAYHLAKAGFRVSTAANGPDALKAAREERPDIVILDLMLPGVSGYDVLAELRKREETRDVGVILLTARREETDRIRGLSLGADDYLTKPFGVRELVARTAALMRRARAPLSTGDVEARPIAIRGVELDPSRRGVRVRGVPIDVTRQEFNLLYVLASNPGIVFTRERLLSRVWQEQSFVTGRSVDTLVKRLRKKIEIDPAAPQLILTVWGDGYKFADA